VSRVSATLPTHTVWFLRGALSLLLGGGALLCAGRATAAIDHDAGPPPRVAGLAVSGRVSVDSLRIVRLFDVGPGSAYDARAIQAGLRRLWTTGLFDDVSVWGRTDTAGVWLTVRISERPHVAAIEMKGTAKLKEDDLKKHVGFQPGDAWRSELLETGRDSVMAEYLKEGYREASVRAEADSSSRGMRVLFTVVEGTKAKLSSRHIEGTHAFPEAVVVKKLASKTSGFLRSGTVKEEKLKDDVDHIKSFYRERGYRDVAVERLPFRPDPKKKNGDVLTYKVTEGAYYTMGEVRWQGNDVIKTAALEALPQPLAGGPYNATKIQAATSAGYALYAEEGRLYTNIDPTEIVRDSNRVDLAFQVSEGPPSHVRQVVITGNSYTKENVIRRELVLHEGDLFRRSRLQDSQQNAFRLGYFQDVGVDFQGADSSDVDVLFKIKEKQTGTAQAGAGYSSDGGLTGFVNLGHNNLFGNGQSVNIQLERGSRTRVVDLSFTDPWVHDTPLSLGGSAYSSQRDIGTDVLTEYNERRRGFSFTLGRPIPNLRYVRGTVGYTLEGVTISLPTTTTSPQLLALQTAGEQVTSSVQLGLTRNNTNNPFYPSHGQRGTVSSEFAGGPLGGDFSFNKTRLDSRWYFPSFGKNSAHMVRLRLGAAATYARNDSIPVYERFRLGGVTQDGVRGYDDYSIVPKENDTFPRYAPGSGVTLGGFTRDPVPYPGGRYFGILTLEEQFLIVSPVHGVIFAEGGNVWNRLPDVQPFDLRKSAGVGVRLEIPVLGNVGFDYAYGFDKAHPGWHGHFLLGAQFF
jgi:outer membrane protein insertion porin family